MDRTTDPIERAGDWIASLIWRLLKWSLKWTLILVIALIGIFCAIWIVAWLWEHRRDNWNWGAGIWIALIILAYWMQDLGRKIDRLAAQNHLMLAALKSQAPPPPDWDDDPF